MDSSKVISFIENSFLKSLIRVESITDISYNGEAIYYLDNLKGRQKSDIQINYNTAKDFLRQVANICEKQFSYQDPYLDVTAGKYRINGVHQTIAKRGNDDALTFSIRIASNRLKIEPGTTFLPIELANLFDFIISSGNSIAIGGITGSGKTEFQKYLISRMHENTRVIAIDNILELDYLNSHKNLDFNVWLADEHQTNTNVQYLVRNALRSNPDWIIVAEARGAEMLEILNSTMTGHPIITTIHAFDINSMPDRMVGMVMMNDKKMTYQDIKNDITYHIRFYVYIKRNISDSGIVTRYISSVSYLDDDKMVPLYEYDGQRQIYHKLSSKIIDKLNIKKVNQEFHHKFLESEVS